ncbi:MAG: ATP-binding cassette domain-containing protein [Halobacteriovoraceae bacterium]|nr:ATP-binding cassette domain-containing protein [Halobacteriovoraceae bacterium]
MTSTTTSKDHTLEIQNLYLSFDLDIQKGHTIRDVFVNMLRNPFSSIMGNTEVHPVLENINLTLNKGDIVALIGENGSGKTSLCRCVAGMIQPQQGKILKPKNIQAVFSSASALHIALTGRENAFLLGELMFPALEKKKLKEVVEEALDFSELGKFLEAPFFTYSRGMQARLFLSVVTAYHSELLILDEVYDGADEFFQRKMQGRMQKLLAKSSSVLFISHNAELLVEICNRAFVLHDKKCLYDGKNVEKAVALYKSLHQGGYKTG